MLEALGCVGAEFGERLACFGERFHAVGVRLAVEFVGKADHFFFERKGEHVALWQVELLADDIVQGDARPGVSLTHQCMSRQAEAVEQLASQNAVADVGLVAVAANAWRIGAKDGDVVEHGGFLDKLEVDDFAGMCAHISPCELDGLLCHLRAVRHQDGVVEVARCVVLRDDVVVVDHSV